MQKPSFHMRWFWLTLLIIAQTLLAADTVNGYGLLWRIETPQGQVSYLYGTMHVADPEVVRLPTPVEAAFIDATQFLMEVVLDAHAANYLLQQMTYADPDQSLQKSVSRRLYRRLQKAMKPYGFSEAQLDRLRPWAVLLLLGTPPQSEGGEVLDQLLYQRSQGRQIPTHGLESIEEQVAVFAEGYSDAEMETLLWLALADLPKQEQSLAEMKRLYLARDLAGMLALDDVPAKARERVVHAKFLDRLLRQRNHRMAERMLPFVTQGGVFIAIGALHLPGEEGVIELMRRQGLRVERVY